MTTRKQTEVTDKGVQRTTRTQMPKPLISTPCQAVVTTKIVICEPWDDGTWVPLSAFEDNFNIILTSRGALETKNEVISRLQEIKRKWSEREQIISLENLLSVGRSPS